MQKTDINRLVKIADRTQQVFNSLINYLLAGGKGPATRADAARQIAEAMDELDEFRQRLLKEDLPK